MKYTHTRSLKASFLKCSIILFVFCAVLALLRTTTVSSAHENNEPQKTAKVFSVDSRPAGIHAADNINPRLKFSGSNFLPGTFRGAGGSVTALGTNNARPLALAAADFDGDGAVDLVTAYAAEGRGIISVRKGNVDAFAPTDTKLIQKIQNGFSPSALSSEVSVFDFPVAPDFIANGDFNGDGTQDLVAAGRNGGAVYFLSGDGSGKFTASQPIEISGEISALAVGAFGNNSQSIAVAANSANGSTVSVFSIGKDKAFQTAAVYNLNAKINALANGRADLDGNYGIFAAADGEIAIIHGRSAKSLRTTQGKNIDSVIEYIQTGFDYQDLTLGNFVADRDNLPEIAALSSDGTIQLIQRGDLDTRPYTPEESAMLKRNALDALARQQRGETIQEPAARQKGNQPEWKIVRPIDAVSANGGTARKTLITSNLSYHATDDLMVIDTGANRLSAIPFDDGGFSKVAGGPKANSDFLQSASLVGGQSPVAALPLPRKVNGEREIIVFYEGQSDPVSVVQAPTATITVDRNDDVLAGASACTGAANDCSLRGAVAFANANSGTTINIVAGNYPLTIAGATEQNNANGDVDINTSGTIILGAGAATTSITQTTTQRVMDVNFIGVAGFTFAISNITLANGQDPATFGGGALLLGGPTNTYTVTNCVFNNNRVTGSVTNEPGGAIGLTVGGSLIVTGSTFTNNNAGGSSGGAILMRPDATAATTFSVTNSTFTNNQSAGSGGAIDVFLNAGSSAFTSTITGSTFTTNKVVASAVDVSGGGAIRVAVGSQNSTTLNTVSITKSTFDTNQDQDAAGHGGALTLTSGGMTANFNRFVNNTTATAANGNTVYVQTGGTPFSNADLTRNWWANLAGPKVNDVVKQSATPTATTLPALTLTYTASPASIALGGTTTLTASFLTDTGGGAVAASNLTAFIGVPVTHGSPVRGTLSAQQTTIQATGTATATFTSNAVGAGSATATVDGASASASITITAGTVTVSVTVDHNPALVGQTVVLTATVTPQSPSGSITPVGTIQFRDGGTAIGGAIVLSNTNPATASFSTSILTAGNHTITADFVSTDGNFSNVTGTGLTGNPLVITNTDTWTGATSAAWNVATNWNTGAVPAVVNDVVIPAAGVTNEPTISAANVTINNLTVAAGRTLTINAGLTLTVNGTSTVSGNINNLGTFAPAGTTTYNGTAAQTAAAATYPNLTINNAAGVTIPGNAAVSGTLTLTSGNLTVTVPNVLTIAAAGTISRTSGYIIGNLRKDYTATGTFTYPVGTANGYSPVTDQVTSGTGNLTVRAVQGPEPTVNPATSLQRYWVLTGAGILSNLTFNYLAADVAGNETNYRIVRVSAGVPSVYPATAPNTVTHTATINGVSSYSNWTLSELGPTAASASINGRILTTDGRGISNATVSVTGQNGEVKTVKTNVFGVFQVADLAAGASYTVTVNHKTYQFAPQLVSLTADLTDFNITALPR